MRSIFCKRFIKAPRSGEPVCNFFAPDDYTKKVMRIHFHPGVPNLRLMNAIEAAKAIANMTLADIMKYVAREAMHDLVLLDIEPFTLSEELNILPACLMESDDRSFGDRLLGAGYGLTKPHKIPENTPQVNEGRAIRRRSIGDVQNRIKEIPVKVEIVTNDTRLYTTQLTQIGCEVGKRRLNSFYSLPTVTYS